MDKWMDDEPIDGQLVDNGLYPSIMELRQHFNKYSMQNLYISEEREENNQLAYCHKSVEVELNGMV